MNKDFLQKLLVGTVCALLLCGVFYLFHFAQYRAPEIAKKRAEREAIKAKRAALLTHKRQQTQNAQKTSGKSEDWKKTFLEQLDKMLTEAEISEENEHVDAQETVSTEETTVSSADESADGTASKKPSISPAEYQRLTGDLDKAWELWNILNARRIELIDRHVAIGTAANDGIITEEEARRELELIYRELDEIAQQSKYLDNEYVGIHRKRGTLVEE